MESLALRIEELRAESGFTIEGIFKEESSEELPGESHGLHRELM